MIISRGGLDHTKERESQRQAVRQRAECALAEGAGGGESRRRIVWTRLIARRNFSILKKGEVGIGGTKRAYAHLSGSKGEWDHRRFDIGGSKKIDDLEGEWDGE